jgi:hypothetical protein
MEAFYHCLDGLKLRCAPLELLSSPIEFLEATGTTRERSAGHRSVIGRGLPLGRLTCCNAVILGRDIADQLSVRVGDAVTLLVPMAGSSGLPEPRLRQFKVGGSFSAGLVDHDNTLVLADIDDVRGFAPWRRREYA